MKNLFFLIILLAGTQPVFAQTSDFQDIQTTLHYYLDGGTNNDYATLEKAFHPQATMKFVGDDGYVEVNAREFFKKGIKPGPKQNRKTRVVSIDISGPAASARVEAIYPTFKFIDYMNLLKVDGQWQIVNKIFYKENIPVSK